MNTVLGMGPERMAGVVESDASRLADIPERQAGSGVHQKTPEGWKIIAAAPLGRPRSPSP